jgi:hypothetical protein
MILYYLVPTGSSSKLDIGNIQYKTVGSNLSCFGKVDWDLPVSASQLAGLNSIIVDFFQIQIIYST